MCSTIIESGIDVPSANTIIINRADRFGLAQLHQLRGRVGRSHHQAYAYMLVEDTKSLTPDARKRLEAIEALDELGAGFALASHDLEIRGAGELLGESQSGAIDEVGYTLYAEYLARAVKSIRSGALGKAGADEYRSNGHTGVDVKLHCPALLPESYIPDVHTRLVLYKRLSSCRNSDDIYELQVEIIDRFGLFPDATRNLFLISDLKLHALDAGILSIDAGPSGGRIDFGENIDIDPMDLVRLLEERPDIYRMEGANRLRIDEPTETAEQRVANIRRVIDRIAGSPGT